MTEPKKKPPKKAATKKPRPTNKRPPKKPISVKLEVTEVPTIIEQPIFQLSWMPESMRVRVLLTGGRLLDFMLPDGMSGTTAFRSAVLNIAEDLFDSDEPLKIISIERLA